jgi:SAM-dependent methyltransferase
MTIMMQQDTQQIDPQRMEMFLHRAVGDMASAAAGALTLVGHRLGLYRGMAGAGPLTPEQLAEKTGTDARYVREWLNTQAAGGYVDYRAQDGTYRLPPEQAAMLADADSPIFLAGGFDVVTAMWVDADRIAEHFRSGEGMGWHEHDAHLFTGTEMLFRPGYRAHLAQEWIPALTGVEEKLRRGARVADVGCGHGASAIALAEAYPAAQIDGFDYHAKSIDTARRRAKEAGLDGRVRFHEAPATAITGGDYDLVCFFDCLHDLGDPLGAARRAYEVLNDEGTLMLVEPRAGDRVEDNLNPVGRLFYAASTLFCTPNSKSQPVGTALGAQAGEARLTDVLKQAGFSRVRRAAETPFNMILEARK